MNAHHTTRERAAVPGAASLETVPVRRAPLLARVTAELASTMDAEVAADRLARLLVPALADWCVITLVDDEEPRPERRHLRDIASRHADAALRPAVAEYAAARIAALSDHSFLVGAMQRGEPVEVRAGAVDALKGVLRPGRVHDLVDLLDPTWLTVLPLVRAGRTVGALSLFGSSRGAPTGDELTTLRQVAGAAALALDNARLYRQQRDVAEALQRALLTEPVQPDDLEVVVRYRPAGESTQVGGDWYDAFLQPTGTTMLVIGDVAGHDIEAASVMGQLRSMLRAIAVTTDEGPASVLSRLDAAMRALRITTPATLVVARLEQTAAERERGVTRVRWSCAGHLPPMVVTPDGTVHALDGRSHGPLLGIVPDSRRAESEITLERGSTLVMYTDGLIERRDRDLRAGLGELRRALTRVGRDELDALCDALVAELPAGVGEDDVALVAVRLHEQDADPAPEGAVSP
ncbi:SpoIIE family protein phosphatase [Cellulomonas fimi]|uniref:PP2C family protein-serine/threonine phosphatase n=1 Tax=Cellulomonas fimi TaxID=1708 RepID=UPI00234D136F|nr:SpoIIE family protein phosphatase [Cellulomonas fimi]MDC7120869.1 SpoIIE family protein phosphatase [Cellulomonas fimi]